MKLWISCISCLLLALLEEAALAASGAPPQLHNKTIVLSWAYVGSGRMARGRIVSFNALTTQSIYVSSSGRLFIRSTLRSARRAQIGRTKDLEPGYKIGGQGYARGERFQGNTLVGTSEFASGARQFTAKFDSGFSTCTLNVVMGTSGGTTMRLKGASGEMVDINSISAVSPTCLIQSGNAFAGQ